MAAATGVKQIVGSVLLAVLAQPMHEFGHTVALRASTAAWPRVGVLSVQPLVPITTKAAALLVLAAGDVAVLRIPIRSVTHSDLQPITISTRNRSVQHRGAAGLVVRTKGDFDTRPNKPLNPDPATVKANKEEFTGVFVIANKGSPFPHCFPSISSFSRVPIHADLPIIGTMIDETSEIVIDEARNPQRFWPGGHRRFFGCGGIANENGTS